MHCSQPAGSVPDLPLYSYLVLSRWPHTSLSPRFPLQNGDPAADNNVLTTYLHQLVSSSNQPRMLLLIIIPILWMRNIEVKKNVNVIRSPS